MRVRASVMCFVDNVLRREGDEFDYPGAMFPDAPFAPVDGPGSARVAPAALAAPAMPVPPLPPRTKLAGADLPWTTPGFREALAADPPSSASAPEAPPDTTDAELPPPITDKE